MDEEINPKEHLANHMDYKDVKEISQMDQIVDSEGIKKTSVDSQGFLDQAPEMMMNLEVEDRKQGVGYLGQFQVQSLELQVTVEVQDELLMKTLQYQTMKGNYEVNAMVQP